MQAIQNQTLYLEGDYVQVYSNYFIQSTSEIDWKCVQIYFTMPNGGPYINSTKTAYLHGRTDEIVNVKKNYRVDVKNNNTYLRSKTESLLIRMIEPSYSDPDYFVASGVNNITLFVFAKNYTDFITNHNDNVLRNLISFDTTGAYKSLRPSFESTCLSKV